MEWTEERDLCLCQEILVLEPFKAKKGSIARGQIWGQIAVNLNSLSVSTVPCQTAFGEREVQPFEREI